MRRKAQQRETHSANRKTLRRLRMALIRAEYNSEITQSLEEKCLLGLREGGIGANQVECYTVPGCFEIPLLAQKLAARKRHDILIVLGCIIRGETLHFELVAHACARGIMEVCLKHDVPIIFQVLAADHRRDAMRRAGNNRFNKGFEAAQAALAILTTLNRLEE